MSKVMIAEDDLLISDMVRDFLEAANAGRIVLSSANGEACITKPYSADEMIRALKIVEQIITTGVASPPFPRGNQVLGNKPTSSATEASQHA
jgi:hypothetical protein